jgi:hypothetical protein
MATITQTLMPEEGQPATATFPQYQKVAGSNFPVSCLAYDAATKETIFFKFHATGYGSGNLTLDVFWYADTASSGDIVWGAQVAAITPNVDTQDVETKAFAAANTATQTHLGTTGQRLHQCTITITVSNLDGVVAGDIVWLALYRDAAAGGDTMTGDALFIEALLSYSDT